MVTDKENDLIQLKVDVSVLKTQVSSITQLCDKMDKVIEKLVDNHNRIVDQIYNDMQRREDEKDEDVKELHSRITNVDRNLSDKIELTERRIMEEIKNLRVDIAAHNKKEDSELRKILQGKWMLMGAILVLSWLFSNVNLSVLGKLFN